MQMILQNISLILTVHSLVKAFNLSSWVILQNIEFFSFNFCYRVLGLWTFFALLSQLLSFFSKINFFLKKIINSVFVLRNCFNNSVDVIALNLVWIAFETNEGVSHRRFFGFSYYNSLFLMNLPFDVLCLISLIIFRLYLSLWHSLCKLIIKYSNRNCAWASEFDSIPLAWDFKHFNYSDF